MTLNPVIMLVVDRDHLTRWALQRTFGSIGQVFAATSAHEALDLIKDTRIDVLIVEGSSSETDNVALVQQTKCRWPAARILLISADSHMDQSVWGPLKTWIDRSFEKPFDIQEIRKTVLQLTVGPSQQATK